METTDKQEEGCFCIRLSEHRWYRGCCPIHKDQPEVEIEDEVA